jgi:hypothetical protein
MDLTPYVASLGRELLTAAETSGADAGAVIERLTVSMESAIRLALLEALSAAADEISRDLAPGSVQVHLRGRDPEFVVTSAPGDQPVTETPEPAAAPGEDAFVGLEDGPAVRVNLRLPDQLKNAFEEAAGREGRSLNAWLVRAGSTALRAVERESGSYRRARGAQQYTGWAR